MCVCIQWTRKPSLDPLEVRRLPFATTSNRTVCRHPVSPLLRLPTIHPRAVPFHPYGELRIRKLPMHVLFYFMLVLQLKWPLVLVSTLPSNDSGLQRFISFWGVFYH